MTIQVVAAAVIIDQRLLTVSKAAAPTMFYLPGGKPEAGESHHETLVRELAEELQTSPLGDEPYLVVDAPAALEGVPMRMTVYTCRLAHEPRLAAELVDLRWITGAGLSLPDLLAPALSTTLLPRLRRDGLIRT